ncbi:MAG: hypothetical protein JWN85_3539 [Gammaproteobacteria bacterium]|nr:hypothetical protein [Gammaproteobacteria bacterium]
MSTLCDSVRTPEFVRVTDGFTSISVMPDEIPRLTANGLHALTPLDRAFPHRLSTGARVTVEFITNTQVQPDREVRACYDIAGDGTFRECMGIPNLTHTTPGPHGNGAVYHYRLTHWIAPQAVMHFVQR